MTKSLLLYRIFCQTNLQYWNVIEISNRCNQFGKRYEIKTTLNLNGMTYEYYSNYLYKFCVSI